MRYFKSDALMSLAVVMKTRIQNKILIDVYWKETQKQRKELYFFSMLIWLLDRRRHAKEILRRMEEHLT